MLDDILRAFVNFRVWLRIAAFDAVLEHRRRKLGLFWEPLQTIAWVGGLYMVFGDERAGNPLSYLLAGVIGWRFIASIINNGGTVFSQYRGFIMNLSNPISGYLLQRLFYHLIVWSMNLLVIVGVSLISGLAVSWNSLYVLVAVAFYLWSGFWCLMLIGCFGARFPDVAPACQTATRLLFFMTPIFWAPGGHELRTLLATYNPFTYYLEIFRAPLMGQVPSMEAFAIVTVISLVGTVAALVVFNHTRNAITYWL